MQLVPDPTPTNAKTIIPNGQPEPPWAASVGGPDLYVNAAKRYPPPNRNDESRDRGGGE